MMNNGPTENVTQESPCDLPLEKLGLIWDRILLTG